MEVSHLAGWAGGPASSCELFLDLGCIAPIFFCLLHSPMAFAASPLQDPEADEHVLQLSGSSFVYNAVVLFMDSASHCNISLQWNNTLSV